MIEVTNFIRGELHKLPKGKVLKCPKLDKEDIARIIQTSKPPEGFRYAKTFYGDYMYITLQQLSSANSN